MKKALRGDVANVIEVVLQYELRLESLIMSAYTGRRTAKSEQKIVCCHYKSLNRRNKRTFL